jgi:hypothetical protein
MATDPDLTRFVPLRKAANVFVFSRTNDLWWAAICNGRFGLAPSEYVRLNSLPDADPRPELPPPLPDRSASSQALNESGVAPPLPPSEASSPDVSPASSGHLLLPKSRPATLAARFSSRRRSMSKPELVNPETILAAAAATDASSSKPPPVPSRSPRLQELPAAEADDDDEAPPLPPVMRSGADVPGLGRAPPPPISRTVDLHDFRVPPPPPGEEPTGRHKLASTLNVATLSVPPLTSAASAASKTNKHLVIVRGRSNSSLPRPNAATVAMAKGHSSSKPPPPPPSEEPPTPAPPTLQKPPTSVPPVVQQTQQKPPTPVPPVTQPSTQKPPPPQQAAPMSLEQREVNVRAREARVAQREAELDALAAKLAARSRELDEQETKLRERSMDRPRRHESTAGDSSDRPKAVAPSPPSPVTTAADAPPPLPPQLELPEGWGEARDADGEVIYFDIFTRHEQREKPVEPSLGWRRMVFSRQRAAVTRLRESVMPTDQNQLALLKKLQDRVDSSDLFVAMTPPPVVSSKVNNEQRMRQVREFYETESTFNSGLEAAICYRDTLATRVASGALHDLSRDELRAVFPDSFGAVLALSNELTVALAPVHAAPTGVPLEDRVGSVMCRFAPRLSVLADYIVAYQHSSDVLKEVSKRPAVAAALADLRAQSTSPKHNTLRVGAKLTLPDLLIMPVQRCPRYEMLINALLSNTDDADPERPKLLQALSLVHAANEHNNDMLAQAHNEAVIRSIASEILNCPPLLIPGRQYLLRSTLVRSTPPHRNKDRVNRTYILFSDLLIEAESLSKPVNGAKLALSATIQINAHTSARAVQSGVVSESERVNAFFLRHGPKGQLEDIFIAPTAAVANAWRTAVDSLVLV